MITNVPLELDMRNLSVALGPKGPNEIWKASSS
jgi:hypothetical protein